MNHYKYVEFLSNSRMSSPPIQTKAPLSKIFWRRFCSDLSTSTSSGVKAITAWKWSTRIALWRHNYTLLHGSKLWLLELHCRSRRIFKKLQLPVEMHSKNSGLRSLSLQGCKFTALAVVSHSIVISQAFLFQLCWPQRCRGDHGTGVTQWTPAGVYDFRRSRNRTRSWNFE